MVDKVTLAQRIVGKVEAVTESGCWIWLGSMACGGRYGCIKIDGVVVLAHRAAYAAFVAPIPEGQAVCHHCDVGLCVNPSHLFVGSHRDNMADMVVKGRNWNRAGQLKPQAKLRASQIISIRASDERASVIAARLGVSEAHVINIRAGRCWPEESIVWHKRVGHLVPAALRARWLAA